MDLKKYLPFERYCLATTLKPQEIRDRLYSRIAFSPTLIHAETMRMKTKRRSKKFLNELLGT